METRQMKDRIDVAVPQFKSEACESCFEDKELINVGRKIVWVETTIRIAYHICLDCLKELRPVSDITNEMVHEYNQDIYYKVYDRVNFG